MTNLLTLSSPAAVAWLAVAAFMVILMQGGLAMLSTGLTRAKNVGHTMSLNLLGYALAVVGFFVCGFALLGEGKRGLALAGVTPDSATLARFLFLAVAMSVATAAPIGALAERWRFKSLFWFALISGAVICPLCAAWTWGGGWIAQLGTRFGLGNGGVDYAGSAVIHLQAGAIALVGCILIGPRIGKYEGPDARPIFGHNISLVLAGTFVLAFGWMGLNAGPALAAGDGSVALVAVNTILASAGGTLSACLLVWRLYGKPDPSLCASGLLSGLAAISGSCAFVAPWAAMLIGLVAGVLCSCSVMFWERRGVDDPAGAISIHGVGGLWGVIAVGLFAGGTYGSGWNGVDAPVRGLLYGNGSQLGAQAILAAACLAFDLLAAGAAFWVIGWAIGGNRVSPQVEIAGLDIPEMGAPGYPEFISHTAPEQVPTSEVAAAKASMESRFAPPVNEGFSLDGV